MSFWKGLHDKRAGAAALTVLAGVAVVATGCSPTSTTHATSAPSIARGRGNVAVFYAGSMESLRKNLLGPRLHEATGYTFQGIAGGSEKLAAELGERCVGARCSSARPRRSTAACRARRTATGP